MKTSLTKTDILEGILEQVITNNKEIVTTLQVISTLLKNMDDQLAILVQKL
jgi:hypothetical protein